jgi:hypothetical protein
MSKTLYEVVRTVLDRHNIERVFPPGVEAHLVVEQLDAKG